MRTHVTNAEVAKLFDEIADYLEIQNVAFKPRAYRRAAQFLGTLPEEVTDIYDRGGLKGLVDLPEVGPSMAEKIQELIKTGRLRYIEKLRKALPIDLSSMTAVEGIGPKTAYKLYKALGVKNLNQLETAVKAGKISKVPGFGKKSGEEILRGIEFYKKSHERMLLGEALPLARKMVSELKQVSGVRQIIAGGSIRRMQETIGDIDLLAVSDDSKKVMAAFCKLPEVIHVYETGPTRSAVRLRQGIDADLRVVPQKSFGAALQYFTGDKKHNIALRTIAKKKGLKLNEYGVFRGRKSVAGRTEEDVYRSLGLQVMEPELRTNTGEFEASRKKKLPKLVELKDIRGDLHVHTTWTDGNESPEAMVAAAKKLGYEYVALTDHTQYLKMTNGMDEKRLARYMAMIDKLNKKIRGITVLRGAEVNILPDGRLDINDATLAKLDVVLVGVHSHFNQTKAETTKRVLRAISNPHVNIFVHPTGRILQQRPGYQIDLDAVFKAAAKQRVALEASAFYARLDLADIEMRRAIGLGCKIVVNTDSHHSSHLAMMELGVAQARRAWAERKDVINTWPLGLLKKFLNL